MFRVRSIYVTAAIAGFKVTSMIFLKVVIVDEGFQIKEAKVVNPLIGHLTDDRLPQAILLKDPRHLLPTVDSLLVPAYGFNKCA